MIRGKLPSQLAVAVALMTAGEAVRDCSVRHCRARHLTNRGFLVIHTPTRANRQNVSVVLSSPDDPSLFVTSWNEDQRRLFESCFDPLPRNEDLVRSGVAC